MQCRLWGATQHPVLFQEASVCAHMQVDQLQRGCTPESFPTLSGRWRGVTGCLHRPGFLLLCRQRSRAAPVPAAQDLPWPDTGQEHVGALPPKRSLWPLCFCHSSLFRSGPATVPSHLHSSHWAPSPAHTLPLQRQRPEDFC